MSERIYVIEDDENIQEIIKLSLESSGYQITLFNNAIDAIVAIHEDTPDLAIFDVMLPELDGISAIKQIRKTNTTLPILILSVSTSQLASKASHFVLWLWKRLREFRQYSP